MQNSNFLIEAQNNCTYIVALSGKLDFMMVVLFCMFGVFLFGTSALHQILYFMP